MYNSDPNISPAHFCANLHASTVDVTSLPDSTMQISVNLSKHAFFDVFALLNWCKGAAALKTIDIPGYRSLETLYYQVMSGVMEANTNPKISTTIPVVGKDDAYYDVAISGSVEGITEFQSMLDQRTEKAAEVIKLKQRETTLSTQLISLQMENSFMRLKLKELGVEIPERASQESAEIKEGSDLDDAWLAEGRAMYGECEEEDHKHSEDLFNV